MIYSAKLAFRGSSQWNVSAYLAAQAAKAQGSSAIIRDRHVARSFVRVAAGRLPGSVKIRWQIQNTCDLYFQNKRGEGRHTALILPAWKYGSRQHMVPQWSSWKSGRCLAATGPAGSAPHCGGSVSARRGKGFWIPRRTSNPKSVKLSVVQEK